MNLFSGAGGITQGLLQAGFNPVASAEISPIASATHQKNFPNCIIFVVIYMILILKNGWAKLAIHSFILWWAGHHVKDFPLLENEMLMIHGIISYKNLSALFLKYSLGTLHERMYPIL
jgi:site-specific DNA-cytosine methylase